jgi:hypothetical protein
VRLRFWRPEYAEINFLAEFRRLLAIVEAA